jgi:hypothetical protein
VLPANRVQEHVDVFNRQTAAAFYVAFSRLTRFEDEDAESYFTGEGRLFRY